MSNKKTASMLIWRLMRHLNQRIAAPLWSGNRQSDLVLLLTTIGRKSGLPRHTPLQYEKMDDLIYVASARGTQADWYRNILANPQVEVRIKAERFRGVAEAISDAERIADFLELRLKCHPLMIGLLMRLEGLPLKYTRRDLERIAAKKAMVVIRLEKQSV